MLLLIEGYSYPLNYKVKDGLTVKDILKGIVSFPKLESSYIPKYVGYCYSKKAKDVIFFLPKVVLTGNKNEDNKDDTVFGASPLEIIDFDDDKIKSKFKEDGLKDYKEFLSSLSIWIYRSIQVYKKYNNTNILESRDHQTESKGKKKKHNTLLDIIIALSDFNKNNQDYFTFIAKNLHSGHNKIQWLKTIAHTEAFIQNGTPIYTNPLNKKKIINFEEELLVIYFSILNYISEIHGFRFEINFHYELIRPEVVRKKYIEKKYGCKRLKQIKYKYFSDKALRIWDLCYAFFDREYKIAMNQLDTDYLLAKKFDHVFEMMIDSLIGGDDKKSLPNELINQKDGKMVDHMFIGQGLIEQTDISTELTYYIGDSKYYKRSIDDTTNLDETSIYKQYTYAKNVVQWNMDLFLDDKEKDQKHQPQLRDPLTEGYNLIPNFFISARIPSKKASGEKFLSFDDFELKTQDGNVLLNRQFENRLFDRDTILLYHYDVNFLFIVSLYGRDKKNRQAWWRDYIRNEFRDRIQSTLNKLYTFRVIQPLDGKDCYQFIQDNFHLLNGKIYRPRQSSNYLILALMKTDGDKTLQVFTAKARESAMENNEEVLEALKTHFHIGEPFALKRNFESDTIPNAGTLEKQDMVDFGGVLMVMMEQYENKSKKFLNSRKIAIAIKDTVEGKTIKDNADSINYILFHTRSNTTNKHFFKIKRTIVMDADMLGSGIYKIPKNEKEYVVLELAEERSADAIFPKQIEFTPKTRYNSQFVRITELKNKGT